MDAPGMPYIKYKKGVEHFVYLQEALVSRVQINNTPHPYGDYAECMVHQLGDECNCLSLNTLKFTRFPARIKAKTLSSNM